MSTPDRLAIERAAEEFFRVRLPKKPVNSKTDFSDSSREISDGWTVKEINGRKVKAKDLGGKGQLPAAFLASGTSIVARPTRKR